MRAQETTVEVAGSVRRRAGPGPTPSTVTTLLLTTVVGRATCGCRVPGDGRLWRSLCARRAG